MPLLRPRFRAVLLCQSFEHFVWPNLTAVLRLNFIQPIDKALARKHILVLLFECLLVLFPTVIRFFIRQRLLTMPLEVAAGIGLAAAIVGLIKFVQPMVDNLGPTQHGKEDLKRLILTLKTLQSSHEALTAFVGSNHDQQSTILWYLREPKTRCIEILLTLENRLKKHNFVDRFIVGAKWDKKLDKYMKLLDDARGCFDLAIQVDQ